MNNELINIETNELDIEVSKKIAEFEKQVKEIKEKEDELKSLILEEMERKEIIKIENEDLIISYVSSTDREKFDSKKLKEDNQELYDQYITMVPVKASIRIKVK